MLGTAFRRACTACPFRLPTTSARCISSSRSSSLAQEVSSRKRAARATKQDVEDAEPKPKGRGRPKKASERAEDKHPHLTRLERVEPSICRGRPRKVSEKAEEKDQQTTRMELVEGRGRTAAWGPVSEDLCDTILKQLGPSLSQYRGGNIIDVFPGQGLFSRKLHDLIQPECHYLVEDRKRANSQPWLGSSDDLGPSYVVSLLEDLGKYDNKRHKYGPSFSEYHTWKDVIAHCGTLPIMNSPEAPEDINSNTLFIVNTSRLARGSKSRSKKVNSRFSTSESFTHHLLEDTIYRLGVHKQGTIRCLLWVGQEEKSRFVPRALNEQSKSTWRSTDIYHAQEVTGHPSYETAGRRVPAVEVRSAWNVAKRMRENGMELPEDRRSKLHDAVWKLMLASEQDDKPAPIEEELRELESLEDALVRGEISRYRAYQEGEDKRKSYPSSEYLRLLELQEKFDKMTGLSANYPPTTEAVLIAVSALRSLFNYERALRVKYPEGEYLEPQLADDERARLSKLVNDVESSLNAYSGRESRRMTNIWSYFDNEEALRVHPPLLDWDNRSYEPVACKDDEFDPPFALSLIDFKPIVNTTSPKQDSRAASSLAKLVVNNAYEKISRNLETVAHGAGTELLPQCPSVLDPAKQGHLNVQYINTRLLTHEQMKEIHAAWDRWPFRLSEDLLKARIQSRMKYEDV